MIRKTDHDKNLKRLNALNPRQTPASISAAKRVNISKPDHPAGNFKRMSSSRALLVVFVISFL